MKYIDNILKYIGYFVVSLLLGWASDMNEVDFVEKITPSIIPILLTLTVLHTTLTNLLLSELLKYKAGNPVAIGDVLGALKRSAIIELALIVFTFILLVIEGAISALTPQIIPYKGIIINALIVFDVLYFVYVIYDNIDGWYKLLKENNTKEQ